VKRWKIVVGAAIVVAISVAVSTPLFFFYRDNFSTHYPVKDLTSTILHAGELPLWNPQVGGGQPLAGNPNTLAFYPDTLLYMVFPPRIAFDLHFIFHVLAGVLAMFGLLLARGVTRRSAAIGAALYLVSGVVASSFAFYNLVTAIALVPLALLAIERLAASPSWRRGLELGAISGLLGLAGEPVTVIATGVACLVFVVGRLDARHRIPIAVAALVALFVVSPLLVAWNEIRGNVERGFAPYSTETALAASVSPQRALEMLVGPFRGVATDGSYVPPSGAKWPPFFLSLYIGILLVPALGVWSPEAWREKALVAAFLFVSLGEFNPVVRAIADATPAFRIVRYPEKLALPLTVIAIVLVAMLLDSNVRGRGESILTALGFGLLALVGVATLGGWLEVDGGVRTRLVVGLVLATVTLAGCAFRDRGAIPRAAMIAIPIIFGAVWWIRTIPVGPAAPFVDPSPVAAAVNGERIYRDRTTLAKAGGSALDEYRQRAFGIDPAFGVVYNVAYAGERSPDGMYSYLSRIVAERIESADVTTAIRYLRFLGCRAWVTTRELDDSGLQLRDGYLSQAGGAVNVYSIPKPLPTVLVPKRAFGVRTIQDAVKAIEGEGFDERETILVGMSHAKPVLPAAIVSDVSATTQGLAFHVIAAGDTALMLDRTYFDAWDARAGDRRLAIFPADLDRLGLEVPRGEWDVTVRFGRKRTKIALLTALSLLLLVAAGAVSWRDAASGRTFQVRRR